MTQVSDKVLQEIEQLAVTVDRLDVEACAGDEPYVDEKLDATLSAKRSRLLLELEEAELLTGDATERKRLAGFPLLAAYANAAVALDRYLDTPGYKRLVKEPRVTRLLDSPISLDWFRVPSGYTPNGVSANDWLALCDLNFRDNKMFRAGSLFTRLEGKMHRLYYRTELNKPRLYRAVLA